jgi:hypothetical protein
LKLASATAHAAALGLQATARGDEAAEKKLDEAADAAERDAEALAALASADEAAADHDVAVFGQLTKEYAEQAAHKVKKFVDGVGRAIKKAVKAVAHAAAKVGKVIAAHAKGLEQAALVAGAVVLTVVNVAQLGLDPLTDAAEGADIAGAVAVGADTAVDTGAEAGADAAGEAGGDTAEETEAEEEETSCGGESFTAGTKVLLASGAAVPISQLKVGEKVLATNTRTGKTQPEAIAAVLVHHDTDLYDLKIRAGTQTSVIDTTSTHLFFVPGTGGNGGRWVKAGALRYGGHLRTPGSGYATVTGGWTPKVTTGWMWDLTIPGNNDHDFYINTAATAVLAHNQDAPGSACPTAQKAAQDAAQNIRESSSGRPPTATAAAVDRTTGEVYTGTSGELTEAPSELADRLPSPSNEPWSPWNCAEVAACSKAIAAGSKLEDLDVATVRTATGEDFPPCDNCSTWLP